MSDLSLFCHRINVNDGLNKINNEQFENNCFNFHFQMSFLEVCVDSIESGLNAVAGGAQRLELCSALSEGGLTPTVGTLKILKEKIHIPIFVMIRPRRGNDFNYTDLELDSMLHDIKLFLNAGADGFVFGALNATGSIDVSANQKLLMACGGKPVTFHRAFDVTDPTKKLENAKLVAELGFSRILTSGFCSSAEQGVHNLQELVDSKSGILIMAGAGVNAKNVGKILSETGCKEFHASARVKKALPNINQGISMGGGNEDLEPLLVCSESAVRELLAIARNV